MYPGIVACSDCRLCVGMPTLGVSRPIARRCGLWVRCCGSVTRRQAWSRGLLMRADLERACRVVDADQSPALFGDGCAYGTGESAEQVRHSWA